MFKKAKDLPTSKKIIYTIVLSILWIFIASNLNIEIKENWILSTLVIAGISSVFFGFNTKIKKEDFESLDNTD